jgi:hypothetical protein
MFTKRTLFVVGAGASHEVGLPVGTGLAATIAKMFTYRTDFGRVVEGDERFIMQLANQYPQQAERDAHLLAARQVASGVQLVGSIDNYIDTHRHDPRIPAVAKFAIVYAILNAEAASSLCVDKSRRADTTMNFEKLKPSWFYHFGTMLVEGVPLDEIDNLFNNVKIVCFNYDRCIEHFLTNWLAAVYAIPIQDAEREVAKLFILRPYGIVAPILERNRAVQYGASPGGCDVRTLKDGIKTYNEQLQDDDLLRAVSTSVAEAEVIVMLGFGFHPQNMKILNPAKATAAKRIIVSAYETSDANKRSIHDQLRNLGGKGPKQTKGAPAVTIDPNMCGRVLANNRRDILAHDL